MKYKKIFFTLFISLFMPISYGANNVASSELSLFFDDFLSIKTISNPVLVANITDKTGNLYAPLSTRFRVVSNCSEKQTLYLKAEALTENGIEPAMFDAGNQVYIAFANINTPPKSEALVNCKMYTDSKYSPSVVAYPVISVFGAENKYQYGEGKYKVFIENGTTDITVNIGSQVLKNSFDSNDPIGFYQATLSLTESEI